MGQRAAALGIKAMSLYHHVTNKGDQLDGMLADTGLPGSCRRLPPRRHLVDADDRPRHVSPR